MSRVEELRTRLAAELAVAELEDELIAAKDDGDPDALRDVKLRLRAARAEFRTHRAGSAAANPATVTASAVVEQAGGPA